MKPNIGISEKNLSAIAATLTAVLADEMVLYVKTRKFHWNIAGESFMELHKLFEKQYDQLAASIDAVAERINKLGSKTIGTMEEFLKEASLKEAPGKYPSAKDMLKELLGDHEMQIQSLRGYVDDCSEKYKDAGTADFLTGLMEEHETTAWVLRRYFA
ncbi:Dps family protein [Sediminibacterium soli]|uniref:Dps family protein n=1 Tax=Sediminibacterium soli TaxID=2698829 RepID=UPI0013793DC9|nr:DNA starvation/stationary phase protection protein [Sediminibacterium soli]NCI47392.1 DNA starvation/stationary phase protection protein [Sediminibacterium soli]